MFPEDVFPLPASGKKGVSQLKSDDMGMHGPSRPYQPIAHAGKGSVSHIVQGGNGITIMGQVVPQRAPAGGQGHWSTTYDDTYHQIQVERIAFRRYAWTQGTDAALSYDAGRAAPAQAQHAAEGRGAG